MRLRSFQVVVAPASPCSSRNPIHGSTCQEPLWAAADESHTAHAFEALYQNLLLSLTDLHTTMVCLICFFIKSIMGLIEKIGSATCNLTTALDVCRLEGMSRSSVSDTCVIGVLPRLMRTKTNINTGGASAPIDHYAMRINHLAFSSKNKIYIFNVWNGLTHTLAPSTSGGAQRASPRRPLRLCSSGPSDLGMYIQGQVSLRAFF